MQKEEKRIDMQKKIAVILGDGIGPEVTQQSIKVLDAVARQFKHQFFYEHCLMGASAIDKTGDALPGETLQICHRSDAVLLGAIGHPRYDNDPSAKVRPEDGLLKLRKELGLFANIRPITTYAPLQHLSPLKSSRIEGVDFVIFRELTGGIYFGNKQLNEDKTEASDDCIYHRDEIVRIAHLAFAYAQQRRKVLTLVDKANVLETSRLWRKVVQEMSTQYPDVTVNYLFVDNAAMQIIINPKQFDVILTENMFGDILSDEASVITGSIGLLPSASVGNKLALFEPIHGSYPQAAGKNIANPNGSILSAAMMLDYFGLAEEAELIREAVHWNLANGFLTKDIDSINNYSTATIGDLVSDYVENRIPSRMNKENMVISKSTII
ncbi:3-isopropylmalate dehydrogenase [Segetibacter aerophilus]|uniref:3-isopropylmalate dehydrogenase n=2 Tax=Segetibacter aerophilus TaxID=670293 RepID=A0A512BB49_9BACT|nr:3-isopropylmalate dehydrogenase [Segetibacter aerophilus]